MDRQYRLPETLPATIAILGSRNFPRLDKVEDLIRVLPDATALVSGGAIGVDITAETAGYARGLHVTVFSVTKDEWETLGKRAGPIRNERLLRYVKGRDGFVFVFVAKENEKITPGSKNVIDLCKKMNIPYRVFTEEVFDVQSNVTWT